MNIALAHDSLVQQGGAERVLKNFHELFPEAPVFTVAQGRDMPYAYPAWDVRTSWLQPFFNLLPKLQYWLPLIPLAVRSLRFDGYDAVLSSSSSWIKNITVPEGCAHICYCHTPTRFLWSEPEYVDQEVPAPLRPAARMFLRLIKRWDYAGSRRVTHFIANSREVQRRIQEYYGRDSEVIYPGIDTDFWTPFDREEAGGGKHDYFLLAGRLQAHKHNDTIVEIFNELGLPLHVVGTGRQEKYLRSIAKPNIVFFGRVSDEELRDQYRHARGFIYPQLEDAGLMPLEAAACGTATIGLAAGGSLETIVPGVTGELFGSGVAKVPYSSGDYTGQGNDLRYKDEIKRLIKNWDPQKYQLTALRAHTEQFSAENFKRKISEFINSKV